MERDACRTTGSSGCFASQYHLPCLLAGLRSRYLLPFTVTFLGIYLLMLAWEARKRNHFRPFVLGTIGSVVLVAGRFALESDLLLYVGVAILIAASIWNAWPTIRAKWFASKEPTKGCPACSGNI